MATWEILALVVIAGMMLVGGGLLVASDSGSDTRALTVKRVQMICEALDKYGADNGGAFPTAGQGLAALLTKPTKPPLPVNWKGPYLKEAATVRDGWGQKFYYVAPGAGDPPRPYDLWSLGADGREGGTGPTADVESWNRTTWVVPRP
jgi:general secretion pathway protein G